MGAVTDHLIFMGVCVGGGEARGGGLDLDFFFSSATRACLYIHVFTKRTKTFTLVLAISAGKRGS